MDNTGASSERSGDNSLGKEALKINRTYIRRFRHVVQWAVLLMVTYAGVAFYLFVRALEHGAIPFFSRPPSVEGFLPIGGLMALKLWITEGIFDAVHPASLVIFSGALMLSFLLRKSFCGWICPVGTVSELVWKTGKSIFGKNYIVPKYVDYFLRSVKYVLMSFFLYIILIKMSPSDIGGFIGTSYWKVVDIKMLKFFTAISPATAVILGVIILLSFIYKNVWCRYLCPYGALLGLLGSVSPIGISRNDHACTHCNLCTKSCPSLLAVSDKDNIISPECSGCLNCISCCPSKGALEVTLTGRKRIHPVMVGVSVITLFFGVIIIAHLSGKWNSSLSYAELRSLLSGIANLTHP
jgi:polyferredoxin